MAKVYVIAYLILLGTLLGFVAGGIVQKHEMKPIVLHDFNVGRNQGFVIGCQFAASSMRGVDPGDPLVEMYKEWCTKNAMAFSKMADK